LRIRSIKPEFWRSESLSGVSAEAALLAIGLLNVADDEGYFNANPRLIQSEVFPLRDLSSSVRRLLVELSMVGYLETFFGDNNKVYGRVVNFEIHQRIDKKRSSEIKEKCIEKIDIEHELRDDKKEFDEHSTNPRRILGESSLLEWKGREQGKESGREEKNIYKKRDFESFQKKEESESVQIVVDTELTAMNGRMDTAIGIKDQITAAFDRLWASYPVKDGKKAARSHFGASVKNMDDLRDCAMALENYTRYLAVTGRIPKNGATFFNNWHDWVDSEAVDAMALSITSQVGTKKNDDPPPEEGAALFMKQAWSSRNGGRWVWKDKKPFEKVDVFQGELNVQ
jgi:hypothetical protein